MKIVEKFRDYRTKRFSGIGKYLYSLGISANLMTSVSLLLGITAVYFLFSDYLLFLIFAVLHLLADGLDGLIARISKTSLFGKYFDMSTDSFITILLLIKVGFYLNYSLLFLVAGLFSLLIIVHIVTRSKAQIIFMRTGVLLTLIVATNSLFPFLEVTLKIGLIIAGVSTVYSVVKEGRWFLKR